MEYLTRESPEAFTDYPPLIENERGAAKHPIPVGSVQCPKCKGHGGWNLRLNAYGPGRHFRAACDQCNHWGHTTAKDAQCVHTFDNGRNVGRCLTLYTCTKCGTKRTVDSSD